VGPGVTVAILLDTSVLYANMDAGDRHHRASVELLHTHSGPFLVPQLEVTEVTYLAVTRIGPEAELRFLEDLASGAFTTVPVEPADWIRVAELVWRYRDARLGTVDASAVAAAERLGITTVATLDRRHFEMVRPTHTTAFELLPA
jgi:predicted nucleic acid-binding protein